MEMPPASRQNRGSSTLSLNGLRLKHTYTHLNPLVIPRRPVPNEPVTELWGQEDESWVGPLKEGVLQCWSTEEGALPESGLEQNSETWARAGQDRLPTSHSDVSLGQEDALQVWSTEGGCPPVKERRGGSASRRRPGGLWRIVSGGQGQGKIECPPETSVRALLVGGAMSSPQQRCMSEKGQEAGIE
ncbi:hypothetical protein NDU88_006285 [Pleurodeles waltl]|uniref:Uncharacterized protein n=1 Tax=Pleurodeles waltl TaxID=8319 RepID=A0AAV7MYS0_PLEWA|nr:hypothetical protein NDU88_006285 [Pleurodeles waltl]